MKSVECTKTGKRIYMNKLLLAEDSKKNRVIYNYDDLSSIEIVAKVEVEYDEMALEGDSGSNHIYYYHTKGAKDLKTYFNKDKARLLAGRKILLKDRSSIFKSGRIVKIEKCVYRNYSLYNNYDDEYLDIDFIYLNEFATEFAPKKKEEKKEEEKISHAILIPCACILIVLLTIVLGILTTVWGTARLLSPIFLICSTVANFIVLIIEIECLEQLDKSLKIK